MPSTIRSKILLTFVAMSLLTLGLGLNAVRDIRDAGTLVVETFDKSLMSINYARAAATDFAGMRAKLAAGDTGGGTGGDAGGDDELIDSLREDLDIAAERAQSARASDAARQVQTAVKAWQAAAQRGDQAALDAAAAAVDAQIDLMINYTAGDGFAYREHALAQIAGEARLSVAATAAALLLAAGMTWLLARRIVGPIAAASEAAGRIAGGALDTPIAPGGRDELGGLLAAMAVMRDNIRAMMNSEISQRRSAQSRLLAALEKSGEGVLLIDNDGLVAIANSQLALFVEPVAGLLAPGTPFKTLVAAALDRGCFVVSAAERAQLEERLVGHAAAAIEQKLADGRWLRIGKSASEDGGTVVICNDITTAKQHEAALERTNLWFSTALDNMSQGLALFDAANRLQVANRRFADLFQIDPRRVVPGVTFDDLLAIGEPDPERRKSHGRSRMLAIEAREPGTLLEELADGRKIIISHQPMTDGGWLATYEDVTARRQAEERLAYLANHDLLTGLANRARLEERLILALAQPAAAGEQQSGQGGAVAVLCLGLDGFQDVNETFGHPVGDLVLRATAQRLQACVGPEDLVARLGGDEFAILLLSRKRPGDIVVLAQEIVTALRVPLDIGVNRLIAGTSIGIAMSPSDGNDAETLLKKADTALHRAKSDGRGLYRFFEHVIDVKLQARRQLQLDLRQALDEQSFQLFYQPLIEARSERLCGFEALLRWQHPVRGMISPAEFIPLAEESDLIVPLGEWVLRAACREAMAWPDTVKVAVNVSALQFRSPNLVAAVADALARSGLPPGRLELEITESVLLHDSRSVMGTLHRLHELGLHISMDDFGTGYSSLSYLRSFPFDKIKIDQSFVRDLATTAEARAIVRAIIGMGLSLGMRITAEGVEDEAQLAMLRAEGCTEIQGYYYSRPRPPRDLPALLERWTGAAPLGSKLLSASAG